MSKKKLIIIGLATLVLVNMFDVFESAPVPGALLNALLIVAIAALAYLLRTEGSVPGGDGADEEPGIEKLKEFDECLTGIAIMHKRQFDKTGQEEFRYRELQTIEIHRIFKEYFKEPR